MRNDAREGEGGGRGKKGGKLPLASFSLGERDHVCVGRGKREVHNRKRIEEGEKSAGRREGAALVKRLCISAVGRSVGIVLLSLNGRICLNMHLEVLPQLVLPFSSFSSVLLLAGGIKIAPRPVSPSSSASFLAAVFETYQREVSARTFSTQFFCGQKITKRDVCLCLPCRRGSLCRLPPPLLCGFCIVVVVWRSFSRLRRPFLPPPLFSPLCIMR